MNPVFEQAQSMQEEIIGWRRQLHQIPEIGLVLPNTCQFVKDRLAEFGISFQEYATHSGITACIGSGPKTVALRADMDALPLREESGAAFAATGENMHACGHDAHTAMLLAAARLLKDREADLNGTVKLIFQPGEEGPGGAKPMIKDGVLDDVNGIFALHTGCLAGMFPSGQIAVSYSSTFAADDAVDIEVFGKGGHGSRPDLCVDPVAVATLISNNIQYIVSREVDAHKACVITLTQISAGNSYNIIPEKAIIKGTIRNSSQSVRDYVLRRIQDISEKTAEMMHADCVVHFAGYPALVNDESMVKSFLKTAKKQLCDNQINILPHGLLCGEDAAFFFQKVPGCYFFLSNIAPCPADGNVYGHHHPKFFLDESSFWLGSSLMAQAAIDWLDETKTVSVHSN